jgi:hypothetical protein
MACKPPVRSITIAFRDVVFSTGASNTGGPPTADQSFHPLSPIAIEQLAPTLERVRATVRVENATAQFRCQFGYQVSNDGELWGDDANPTGGGWMTVGSMQSGNGVFTTAWQDVGSSMKRAVRFGMVAGQLAPNVVESAKVTITLDLELVH